MNHTYLQEMVSRYGELLDNVMAENPMMDRNHVIEQVNHHFDVEYQADIDLLAGDNQDLKDYYYYLFEDYAALSNGVPLPYYGEFQEIQTKIREDGGSALSQELFEEYATELFSSQNYLFLVDYDDLKNPFQSIQDYGNDPEQFDRYYSGKVLPKMRSMLENLAVELENKKEIPEREVRNPLPRIPLHAWGAYARALRDQKPETPEQEQAIWNQLVANNFGVLTDKKVTYANCVNHANPIKVKKTLKDKLANKFLESKLGKLVNAAVTHLPIIGKKLQKEKIPEVPEPVNFNNELPSNTIPSVNIDPLDDLKNNINVTKTEINHLEHTDSKLKNNVNMTKTVTDHLEHTDSKLENYMTWYQNNKETFLRAKEELKQQIEADDKRKTKLRQDEAFQRREINTYHRWMQVGTDKIEHMVNSPAAMAKRKAGMKADQTELIFVVMPTIDDKILDKKQYDAYLEKGYTVVKKPLNMILEEAKAQTNVVNQKNYISHLSTLQAIEREQVHLIETGEALREDLNTLGKAEGLVRQEETIQKMKAEQERKASEQAEREAAAKKEAAERAKAELEAQRKKDDMGFYQRQAERQYVFPTSTNNADTLSDQFEEWKIDKDIALGVPKKPEEELTKAEEKRIQRKLNAKKAQKLQPSEVVVSEPVAVKPDSIIVEPITLEDSLAHTFGSVESGTAQFIENGSTIGQGVFDSPIVEEPSVVQAVKSDVELQRNAWAAERLQAEKERRQKQGTVEQMNNVEEELIAAANAFTGFTPKKQSSVEVVTPSVDKSDIVEDPKFISSRTSIMGSMSPVNQTTMEINSGKSR